MTETDIAHFDTFGFLFYRQLLSPEEVAAIQQAAEFVWTEELGQAPALDEEMHTAPFVERNETLMTLVDHPLIHPILAELLGEDFLWSGSEGNRGFLKGTPIHHWHADRPGAHELDYRRIKIMIYLDPTTKDTGAIRVIPGSHRMPFHEDLRPFQENHLEGIDDFFGMRGPDVPCYAAESQPGDVLFFNQSLFHGVYGKTGPRRYIALKYIERPTQKEHFVSLKRWSEYAFHPHEGFRRCDRPAVRAMLDGLEDLRVQADRVVA